VGSSPEGVEATGRQALRDFSSSTAEPGSASPILLKRHLIDAAPPGRAAPRPTSLKLAIEAAQLEVGGFLLRWWRCLAPGNSKCLIGRRGFNRGLAGVRACSSDWALLNAPAACLPGATDAVAVFWSGSALPAVGIGGRLLRGRAPCVLGPASAGGLGWVPAWPCCSALKSA